MKGSDSIKKNAVLVNKFLRKELKGEPKQLYDAAVHLIIHGGKRLRPYLVLKSCKVLGGKQSDAMAAASAVEMIHNYQESIMLVPSLDSKYSYYFLIPSLIH